MGDAFTMNLDPEREKAMSDLLAQQALAEQKSDEDLTSAVYEIGRNITESIAEGLGKTWQGVKDVKDELRDFGQSVDEKMDDVVGFIVDPIRKALSGLSSDLTSSFDPVTAAGIVVGAVYALRDDIKAGFELLWSDTEYALELLGDELGALLSEGWEYVKVIAPYVLEGLQKLGDVILSGLDAGWEYFKTTVWPAMLDGLVSIGHWVWESTPDWLKTGLEVAHDIATTLLKLPIRVGAYIGDALEATFKFLGLDTLGDVVAEVSDVLHGLADWLGLTTEESPGRAGLQAAESVGGIAAMEENIISAGGPAATVYQGAKALGVTTGQAAHLASLAETNIAATQAAMAALQASVRSGMDPTEAYKVAFAAFQAENAGGAAATPAAAPPTGGTGSAAVVKAAEIAVAQDTNNTLRKMVALQERALEDQRRSRSKTPHEVIDTVSSSDELSVFTTGMQGGGIS